MTQALLSTNTLAIVLFCSITSSIITSLLTLFLSFRHHQTMALQSHCTDWNGIRVKRVTHTYTEAYCRPQRQFKLTHKLPPATPCSFRLQAVNSIGARCVQIMCYVYHSNYYCIKNSFVCKTKESGLKFAGHQKN